MLLICIIGIVFFLTDTAILLYSALKLDYNTIFENLVTANQFHQSACSKYTIINNNMVSIFKVNSDDQTDDTSSSHLYAQGMNHSETVLLLPNS